MELIDHEVCDPPCERPFPLHEWPANAVAGRDFCEICWPESAESSDGGGFKKDSVTRFHRDSQAKTRPWDLSEQAECLASNEYGITQGGVSIEPLDATEEPASIQEQVNALFLELGKGVATEGTATIEITSEEKGESWDMIKPGIHWLCISTCEKIEEDWMMVKAEIIGRA